MESAPFHQLLPFSVFSFSRVQRVKQKNKKKKSLKQSSTLFLEGQGFDCKTSKSFQNTKYNNTRFVNVNQKGNYKLQNQNQNNSLLISSL